MLFTLAMNKISSNTTNNNGDEEGQDLKDMLSNSQIAKRVPFPPSWYFN
jgi:hypothetical protein